MKEYELYITSFPNLLLVAPDVAVARTAALLRAESHLKLPDAIHVATALASGASAMVSNDRQWKGKFDQPALILLDDFVSHP